MGKMKELAIDLRNQELDNGPEFDSAGFSYEDNQMAPPPDQIDLDTGKTMWVIKGYKIWAETYMQALELLPLIESF